MAQVTVSRHIDQPADELWDRIGGFDTAETWHPAIASCEASDGGTRRVLTTSDGAEIVETLIGEDDHSYSYRIEESPLPVADYTATLAVHAEGEDACTVEWTAAFTASGASDEDAEAVIENIFDTGLDAL